MYLNVSPWSCTNARMRFLVVTHGSLMCVLYFWRSYVPQQFLPSLSHLAYSLNEEMQKKIWLFHDNYVDNQLIFLSVIITPYSLWIKNPVVITARKRGLGQGNVFTGVCLSTGAGVGFAACVTGHTTSIRWGGGGGSWLPSMHHRSHDQHLGCVHPEGLRLGCLPTGELGGGSASRGVYLQWGWADPPFRN